MNQFLNFKEWPWLFQMMAGLGGFTQDPVAIEEAKGSVVPFFDTIKS